MSFSDFVLGKTKLESFEAFEESLGKALKTIKRKKDDEKYKMKVEKRLYKKLAKFFKGLEKVGVEVYLNKKDGGQQIKGLSDIENISLERVYKEYVIKTLKEIRREVDRRIKDGEE